MTFEHIENKIQDWDTLANSVKEWQSKGKKVVFTNGCFDLLHYGHIHYLAEARDLGDKLIVAMNSAASVKRLKGEHRPINDELTRQYLLAALEFVDAVVVFEEDDPFDLITLIMPDILVKGGDWQPHQIIGSDVVLANGGKVQSLPYIDGYSTTNLEKKIRSW
jgi:D-glycero-beta-D-manno-heptose 1-phosphate adenylyltransferase